MTAHLHGYFRSSASWRVRIALALKGIAFTQASYKLLEGEQRGDAFLKLNPQGLVPALEIDGTLLTQSLAMIEYLDETVPQPPLLGGNALERARIRAFAMAIACDIHPIQNLRILKRVKAVTGEAEAARRWAATVNREGLEACAGLLPDAGTPFCFGETPTLADICLVPQMANARRFETPLDAFPRLVRIDAALRALPAFIAAAPDAVRPA